jgi:hypothetical protein
MEKKPATQPPLDKRSVGRPTAYREEYAAQAFKICLLGATDAELADFFEVSEATVNNWKNDHPEFLESIKQGKDEADSNVANSLYRRALGYEHDAVKIVADAKTGAHVAVPYVEHYPPDTAAAIFWLKNRQKAKWRDKHDIAVSRDFNPAEFTEDQLKRIAAGEDPSAVTGN